MSEPELLTIGAFARRCGLTAGSLRFYADCGLLHPAAVDERSGYRYYAPDQVECAIVIRRLRDIDMPLARITEVLRADRDRAAQLIDEHTATLALRARHARDSAVAVKASLGSAAPSPSVRVNGPGFTAAVEQILTATGPGQDFPVLNGMRIEVGADGITLTATDRYRLSTRTVTPLHPCAADWSATVDADELRLVMPWTRRQYELQLSTQPESLRLRGGDAAERTCRRLPDAFPDYRLLLASLPPVHTRALLPRHTLLRYLEQLPGPRVRCHVCAADAAVTVAPNQTAAAESISADVAGPATGIEFDSTTLYAAVSTAVGPDVMLEIAGADLPVIIRSADGGDLTTIAMPVNPDSVLPQRAS